MWLPCILWGSPMGRWKKRQLGFLLRHIQTWAWSRGRLWHCINTASPWVWWRKSDMTWQTRCSEPSMLKKNTSTRARITGSKTSTEAGSHSNLVNIAGVTKINCATSNWPVPTHSFLLLLIDIYVINFHHGSRATTHRNETLMVKPLKEPGPRLSNISLHHPGMRRLAWWHAVGFFHQPGHETIGTLKKKQRSPIQVMYIHSGPCMGYQCW